MAVNGVRFDLVGFLVGVLMSFAVQISAQGGGGLLSPDGMVLSEKNREKQIQLIQAAEQGDLYKVLSLGLLLDVNFQDEFGDSALIAASDGGHLPVVQLLLAYGADPNLYDGDGYSALYYAISASHFTVIKALVKARADIYLVDKEAKENALFEAVRVGDLAIVEWFWKLDRRLVDVFNKEGDTVLFEAIENAQLGVVQRLRDLGADIFRQNSLGESLWQRILKKGFQRSSYAFVAELQKKFGM